MILVTGGAGFIGSNTVDLLLEKGYQVRVFDNFSSGKIENLQQHKNLEIVNADIRDFDALKKSSIGVNTILHLAAQTSVIHSIEDPQNSFDNNLQGFLNVINLAKDKNIKVVFSSSAATYGNSQELPLKESSADIDNVLSPYAIEKLTAEKYLQLFEKLYKLHFVILRYFNVFGPRQDPNSEYSGVISKFMESYRNGKDLIIYGDGNQNRDFINVSDIAAANLLAINYDKTGIFNIATGRQTSINMLSQIINNISSKKVETFYKPARDGEIFSSIANTSLAKKCLQFEAQKTIESISELQN